MTELDTILSVAGFKPREPQIRLFQHLVDGHPEGVVAQAGTGTGKSMAVLASAASHARTSGEQSIIVTPTLTLMNQYRDGDTPIAAEAFRDLRFAELRGRSHYYCARTEQGAGILFGASDDEPYYGGCGGSDADCTAKNWAEDGYICEYQAAKVAAIEADVVVTNADMLIVNDKILQPIGAQIFSLEGSLFVDEAHTLEQKLRDYASRQLHWKSIERFKFAETASPLLARWVRDQEKSLTLNQVSGFPRGALAAIAHAELPPERPKDGLSKQRETQEAAKRLHDYLMDPHENAVAHVGGGSLRYDWINVSASAGELLSTRRYGLVSATVPQTMRASLGIPGAPFIDVGHPFSYSEQAWIGFSAYGGDYNSAKHESNFEIRVKEVEDLICRARGGALLLFSSFSDLERVYERLAPFLTNMMGMTLLKQERDMEASERQALADRFKADGNAVLFGSESFATGFDVPGEALRLVVLWKLPYPMVEPVSNAIRKQSFPKYNDIMKVRAVQAVGRLIRRETDRGIVWVADNRGRRLLDSSDPLTAHLPQFARLP